MRGQRIVVVQIKRRYLDVVYGEKINDRPLILSSPHSAINPIVIKSDACMCLFVSRVISP